MVFWVSEFTCVCCGWWYLRQQVNIPCRNMRQNPLIPTSVTHINRLSTNILWPPTSMFSFLQIYALLTICLLKSTWAITDLHELILSDKSVVQNSIWRQMYHLSNMRFILDRWPDTFWQNWEQVKKKSTTLSSLDKQNSPIDSTVN